MTELLTAAQMRAIELAAIKSGDVTGLELMERAGRGVVEAVFEEWPELAKNIHRAVILCGPGNNGGDGFVVARLLKEWDWEVQLFLFGEAEQLPPDAKVNYDRWEKLGQVTTLTEKAFRKRHPEHGHKYADLYVDALFGTGLTRPVDGEAWNVLTHMCGRNGDNYVPYTVAIDAPSGLCLDSGRVLGSGATEAGYSNRGASAAASLTVAFDSPKIGHFIGEGPAVCNKLVVKDIGLRDWRCTSHEKGRDTAPMRRGGIGRNIRVPRVNLITKEPLVPDTRQFMNMYRWDMLSKSQGAAHKFSHGHALILTGSTGKTGAARLAARGALRIGAGLVTLGCPPNAQMEVANQITALMLARIDGQQALTGVLEDDRLNALCLGPGMELKLAQALVPIALDSGRSTILDAGALSAYQDDPKALFDMLHEKCVLTPHMGEFSRLFPDLADKLNSPKKPPVLNTLQYDPTNLQQYMADIQQWKDALASQSGPAYSKVDAARDAAKRAGCVVLLKGADTIIAEPSGQCSIHAAHYERAAPWLATAGSGDVLAGFITGLLARGFAPTQAAETAAWLHVECALEFGPGLIAEDLPDQLPAVFRRLNL
ncbi:NAD(P)H-hydrate epimerase [Shimia sp.]|uniref:NAD(P)H-hydrate epimerase n=1 Tax=Shimia sp. TaxID=1954381 RepID=UPI0032970DE2